MTWRRSGSTSSAERMAALSLSVPQAVKMISSVEAPSRSATRWRASLTFACTWPPKKCMELGLPYNSQK
jgi:hypothetical protein